MAIWALLVGDAINVGAANTLGDAQGYGGRWPSANVSDDAWRGGRHGLEVFNGASGLDEVM